MKYFILSFLFTGLLKAEITLINFNTMCDVCSGSSITEFSDRVKTFQKIFKIYQADLIALQEVRTVSQLKKILAPFPHYKYIATDSLLLSYADPALVYDSRKFDLITSKNYWLGPGDGSSISLGWKFALPRQFILAKLKDKTTSEEFYFATTHLDNRIENLGGGAKFIRRELLKLKAPIIFAGDTNLTVDMPIYKNLVFNFFRNAFDLKKEFSVAGNYKSDKEICYTRKGKKFPECRVDHVLLNKNSPWIVRKFMLETIKMENGNFPSDHRPVIIKLKRDPSRAF